MELLALTFFFLIFLSKFNSEREIKRKWRTKSFKKKFNKIISKQMTDEFATWRKKLHGTSAATLSGRQRWTNHFDKLNWERIHFFPPNLATRSTQTKLRQGWPCFLNLRLFFCSFRNWFVKNIYMSKHKNELEEKEISLRPARTGNLWPAPR